MNFYIVRHGESEANVKGLVCGQLDYPLTEKGSLQARDLKTFFLENKITFHQFGSTSLARAKSTLRELSSVENGEIHDELLETNTGIYSDWQLSRYLTDIDARISTHGKFPDLKFLGGESLNEMVARCALWLEKIKSLSSDPERNVLIVAHGGPIGALVYLIKNQNLTDFNAYSLNNCGFIHLFMNEDKTFEIKDIKPM